MSYLDVQTALRRFDAVSHNGVERAETREIARSLTKVTGADTTLLTSDGGTISITAYEVDLATGGVLIGGMYKTIAALANKDLLDPADVVCVDLDGVAAVAITADGKDVEVAMCAVVVNGAVVVRGVFGAEAATGAAVAPTAAQCAAALALYAEAHYLPSELGIVFARILIDRAATDTVSMTHTAAASDGDLKGERLAGLLV